jgi:sialic acid synthase SpsE
MVETIAEIGWNHMGNMSLASEMVAEAANCGATWAKFQTWSVARLKPGPWDLDGRRQIYESAELGESGHEFLRSKCAENGIGFLTSVFSASDVDMVSRFTDTVKIPSTELANQELLRAVSSSFKRVFMSTGASTDEEVSKAVDIMSNVDLTILHCVSSYPCPSEKANLPRIKSLGRFGVPVGYSGHCEGIFDAIASIEYGASIIEKHFTIDKNLPGRDNKFAILPKDLSQLVSYIKARNDFGNNLGSRFQDCEKDMRDVYRGRWDG